MLSKDQIKTALPSITADNLDKYFQPLNDTLDRFQINTPARIAMFLANIAEESGCLQSVQENLEYPAARLIQIFPSLFNAQNAASYSFQPIKIANRIYANRMGNGNEDSGDGYKYRGRGPIQITGKAEYSALGASLGMDLINHPELLEGPVYGMLSSGWYWQRAGCNTYADTGDFDGCCDLINIGHKTAIIGDSNGYQNRLKYYNLAKTIFS